VCYTSVVSRRRRCRRRCCGAIVLPGPAPCCIGMQATSAAARAMAAAAPPSCLTQELEPQTWIDRMQGWARRCTACRYVRHMPWQLTTLALLGGGVLLSLPDILSGGPADILQTLARIKQIRQSLPTSARVKRTLQHCDDVC